MRPRLTHEEFVESVNKKFNNNIEILGRYELYRSKLECHCKIDGYKWITTPAKLLHEGIGCKVCKKKENNLKNKDLLNEKLHLINPNITAIGDYVDAKTKILCVCTLCNNEFYSTPNNLLTNYTCGVCGADFKNNKEENIKKRHNKFVEKLKIANENIEVIGDYEGRWSKLKVRCLIDQHEWYAIPSNLLTNHSGCPMCNSISKGEARIKNYLSKANIDFNFQTRFPDLKGKNNYLLSYDFYLPSHNLLIEYQGQQHERPVDYFGGEEHFKIQIENDEIKRRYAKDNDIELLEIWYYDFDNIEQILNEKLHINNKEKSA